MTGTGRTEEKEFAEVYGPDVVEIPTNRPILRVDREDVVFRTRQEKLMVVCNAVEASFASKRPVLVGTASISASEELSQMLTERGIPHNVLNAKNHEQEAAIVSEAGRCGAVTIATNMAGRGTDIKLDEDARTAGGLLVIGTERLDSRRIDDQLRGRSGRQGDPGESRFYLSLEDDLLRLFGQKRMASAFDSLGVAEEDGVSNPVLTKAVRRAQRRVELDHYTQRRKLLEYDQVLNEQREVMYKQRRQVLLGQNIEGIIMELLRNVARDIVDSVPGEKKEQEQRQCVLQSVKELLPQDVVRNSERWALQEFEARIYDAFLKQYRLIAMAFDNPEALADRACAVLLQNVDDYWMTHIDDLDLLRLGIGLVGYAGRDPLEEYKKSAFLLFEEMNRQIRYSTASAILRSSSGDKLERRNVI